MIFIKFPWNLIDNKMEFVNYEFNHNIYNYSLTLISTLIFLISVLNNINKTANYLRVY